MFKISQKYIIIYCGAWWFDLYIEWCIMEIHGRNVDKSGEKIKVMWINN